MPSTQQTKGYALAIVGGIWFGVVVFVIRGNIILRETPFGVIARAFDTLFTPLRGILFFASWAVFLLGWIVVIFYSVRLLNRANKKGSGPAGGPG
jgi:hypothetical protein